MTTKWMLEGFLGYGPLTAQLWLLGMEERCLDEADAAARLAVLPTMPLTLGLTAAHRLYGFDELSKGVAVWEVARDLAAACGLQSSNVGEENGEVLLTEVLPLPRPTNDDEQWPHAYGSVFPNYAVYETAMLARRAERHARLISEQCPRIVLVHGARYHTQVERALVAVGAQRVRRTFDLGNKTARIVELGPTRIVFVHNFGRTAGWSTTARAVLSRFVSALWHDRCLDDFEAHAVDAPIEVLLAGMFHHRMGNVIHKQVAARLPGFMLDASKASLMSVVMRDDFRQWATQPWPEHRGDSPIDRCVARDLEDLVDEEKIRTRLRKRYGGDTNDEIRAAVTSAHARIRAWARPAAVAGQ